MKRKGFFRKNVDSHKTGEDPPEPRVMFTQRYVCLDEHKEGGCRFVAAEAKIVGTAWSQATIDVDSYGKNFGPPKVHKWNPNWEVDDDTIVHDNNENGPVTCKKCSMEMLDTLGMTDRQIQSEIHKKLAKEL